MEIVRLVQAQKGRTSRFQPKILFASNTNTAVDRVLTGLLNLGFTEFVRVGSLKKIHKHILPFTAQASKSDDG